MPDWWRLYRDDKGALGTRQSFKAEFGLAPDVIEYVWTTYCDGYEQFQPKDLLMALNFLKVYNTYDVMHVAWNVSYDTFRLRVWRILEHLYESMDEVSDIDKNSIFILLIIPTL